MIKTRTRRTFGMLLLSIVAIIALLIPTAASAWGWHSVPTPWRGSWFARMNVYTKGSVTAVSGNLDFVHLYVWLEKYDGGWDQVKSAFDYDAFLGSGQKLEIGTTGYWSGTALFRTKSYAYWVDGGPEYTYSTIYSLAVTI